MRLIPFCLFLALFLTGLPYACGPETARSADPDERQVMAYCSSCHAYPEPALLSKDKWASVLPQMALRYGMPADGLNPYAGLRFEEVSRLKMAGIYPDKPQLPDSIWQAIEAFYLSRAPERVDIPERETQANRSPFSSRMQPLALQSNAFISMVKFDRKDRLFIANFNGEFMRLDPDLQIAEKVIFPRPIIDFNYRSGGDILALSIGDLYPNDGLYGGVASLSMPSFSDPKLLFSNLPRPVNMEAADLDQDGAEDLLICNFGNQLGHLAWYRNTGSGYEERIIIRAPGATRAQLYDLDGDGDQDLVALFAQGDEGISLFYNDRGTFSEQRVLRFHPLFGSSDFELLDFDRDGDMDIVLSNGDNADYSIMLKPYHGIRVFLNEEGTFREDYFFPMHGASKVRARDFDQDGDIDIIAASFFPDTRRGLDQSIVYLENEGNGTFSASHFEHAHRGRWMVMDAGDMDEDGDLDVILGSFTLTTRDIDQTVLNHWRKSRGHILVLENNTVSKGLSQNAH